MCGAIVLPHRRRLLGVHQIEVPNLRRRRHPPYSASGCGSVWRPHGGVRGPSATPAVHRQRSTLPLTTTFHVKSTRFPSQDVPRRYAHQHIVRHYSDRAFNTPQTELKESRRDQEAWAHIFYMWPLSHDIQRKMTETKNEALPLPIVCGRGR